MFSRPAHPPSSSAERELQRVLPVEHVRQHLYPRQLLPQLLHLITLKLRLYTDVKFFKNTCFESLEVLEVLHHIRDLEVPVVHEDTFDLLREREIAYLKKG